MDSICIDCRKSANCKRKPRPDQWTVAGCSSFEAYTIVTNADRIRQMTDEELADLLTAVAKKSAETLCENIKTVEVDLSKCDFEILTRSHLSWLKSPAEVDDG